MTARPNRVLRPDGRFINVPRQRGQLFVCATGCCCGHVDRGYAPVRTDIFHQEWEDRRLRNKIHLTNGGCLGPCPLANVVTLFFDGRFIGFQGIDDPKLIYAIYDYLEAMLASDDSARVPLPSLLQGRTFDYFTWSELHAQPNHPLALPVMDMPTAEPGILFLTHADTDLLALKTVRPRLPQGFPPVYAHNADRIDDTLLERELSRTQIVIVRLHGGHESFRHGLDRIVDVCRAQGKDLVCVSGVADFDLELTALSNAPRPVIHDIYNYLLLGGLANFENMLRYLADNLLIGGFGYDLPVEQPQHGIYLPLTMKPLTVGEWLMVNDLSRPTVAILFYRAHWLSGNTLFIDALYESLTARGFNVLPVFAYSLKEQTDRERPVVFDYFYSADGVRLPDVLICTMSFALGSALLNGPTPDEWHADVLRTLGIPILQAIASGMERDAWELSARGLAPLDTAMNVALPEFDGRIISVPISFKGSGDESRYLPVPDRIERVAGLAQRLAALRRKPNHEKRVAIILTNQPGRASRIGNAVGLDAPASLMKLLEALSSQGYALCALSDIPSDGDTLIHTLIDRCAYDVEYLTDFQLAQAIGSVDIAQYAEWFAAFPERNRAQMTARWGEAPGTAFIHDGEIKFAGLEFGNVLVALQPPRGYGMDPQAIYHTPDLPPTHHYAAFYRWLNESQENGGWGADAILHLGKHGTLEWLPGKGVGLSESCYPDLFLADLPLVYPFIVNDPGEGMQAKRRAHAVIIDHLTPPMTTADSYGELDELRQLVDEYYQLEALDPTKLPLLQTQIWELIRRAHLDEDLKLLTKQQHGNHAHDWDPTETEDGTPVSLAEMRGKDFAHLMEDLDGYLCELTSAQIRDGLYIIGQPLRDDSLIDLLVALTRLPNLDTPSLREAVAAAAGFDLKLLLDAPGQRLEHPSLASHADAIAHIDQTCRSLVAELAKVNFRITDTQPSNLQPSTPEIYKVLEFISRVLAPNIKISQREEVIQTLNALSGNYVPPGPSGAPTRGMAHVLPTGRNFYSVDPRSLPSQTAWRVGQALADELLARYRDAEGGYPETVGLSIWGTSAMRTHGDDIAQCFALLGVRPRWQAENRRLLDVEVIPLDELGRPRIDVLMRISGFFRDAFPHLIQLLDRAVQQVAALDEPDEWNFIRKHVRADLAHEAVEISGESDATRRATYRIFGSRPGAYGAGILPLIDERNWKDAGDFATAYVNWGGYAYAEDVYGADMRPVFSRRLAQVEAAVKNQDNREHDIFDSDDYLQYHGGMIAAIRVLSGKTPQRLFGDSSDPARVRVRDLAEETRRVFRSRVVNPKWLESIRRHGYKGGLELAATVDYLFGYDATSEVLEDWMYEQVAENYAFETASQDFLRRSNPWALRDIVSRLQEAVQRQMWAADEEMQKRLRDLYAEIDGDLEERMDRAWQKAQKEKVPR